MFKPSSEEGKEKKDLRVNVKTLAQGCRTNPEAIYLAWFTSSSCVRLCASRDSLVFLCEKSLTAGEKKKREIPEIFQNIWLSDWETICRA